VVAARQQGIDIVPEIMIPLIFTDHEIDQLTPIILTAAKDVCAVSGPQWNIGAIELGVGSMIETPRACVRADRIAATPHMSFVSIGSTDLTRLVFGVSREDTFPFMVRLIVSQRCC
jgi:pyruvate, orthophosphate dikinase